MNEDEILWQSYGNAVRAGREADALLNALHVQVMNTEVWTAEELDSGFPEEDARDDWCHGYWWRAYSLKSRMHGSRLAPLGTITFALSFWRPEDEFGQAWPGARVPKLYVGFDPLRNDPWDAAYTFIGGNGDLFEDVEARPPYLYEWKHYDISLPLHQRSWFFCLPVTSINGTETLQRNLLKPLVALLQGSDQSAAFAGTTVFPTVEPASVPAA